MFLSDSKGTPYFTFVHCYKIANSEGIEKELVAWNHCLLWKKLQQKHLFCVLRNVE